jgi:hypothetical protein
MTDARATPHRKQVLNMKSKDRLSTLSLAGLGLIVGLAWMATPAVAQGTQAQRDACSGDAMNLCGEFIPDPGRTGACLAAKRAQLSPACRAVFSGPVKQAKSKKAKRKKAVKRRARRG